MKLTIGYFYPKLLNLYGDTGNVEILCFRAKMRGFSVEVVSIEPTTKITPSLTKHINIVFMGGGPDSSQKMMYEDLRTYKSSFLMDFIESGGVGLFICGAYQLLGRYYKSADGSILEGLNVFDLYTQHFGNKKPRCIGNVVCNISTALCKDPVFAAVNSIGTSLVGFENHGGRTFLGETARPFGNVLVGHGNNSEDTSEGVLYKNCIGTYLHGPLLSKNPHIADFLLASSLGVPYLTALDDSLILAAHTASKKLQQ